MWSRPLDPTQPGGASVTDKVAASTDCGFTAHDRH